MFHNISTYCDEDNVLFKDDTVEVNVVFNTVETVVVEKLLHWLLLKDSSFFGGGLMIGSMPAYRHAARLVT